MVVLGVAKFTLDTSENHALFLPDAVLSSITDPQCIARTTLASTSSAVRIMFYFITSHAIAYSFLIELLSILCYPPD